MTRCSGTNTSVTVQSKLPVPRLLAKTVAGAAESFLVAAVKPNLTETAKGVGRFLESEARKKA